MINRCDLLAHSSCAPDDDHSPSAVPRSQAQRKRIQWLASIALICAVFAVVLLPSPGLAADDRVALLELDKRYFAAIAGDWVALDTILADEFFYNTASGASLPKAALIAYLKTGAVVLGNSSSEDKQVQLYRDVGLVTGVTRVKVTLNGEERLIASRYLHVWSRQSGDWKLVARQVTYLPK